MTETKTPKAPRTPASKAKAPAAAAPKAKAASKAAKAPAAKPRAPKAKTPKIEAPQPQAAAPAVSLAEVAVPEVAQPQVSTPQPQPADRKPNLGLRAAIDYTGPLAFLVGYFVTHDFLKATWFLVAASAAALITGFALERRVAPMPLITGGAALFFGLLTLVFKDPAFVKMKPTAINLGLAAVLLVGLKLGKNPLKVLMGEALQLSDAGWRRLTLRYGVFFGFVAVLNEVVWRTQPDATWVLFRMPGLPLLALVFSMTQVPSMLKDAKALEIALKATETQD